MLKRWIKQYKVQMLQQIVTETADETVGKVDRTERNKWCGGECKEATRNKNEAYRGMIQKHYTRGAEELYKEMRRIEKRLQKRGNNMKNK
jgi:predicted RNA-binding protein with PIN domain